MILLVSGSRDYPDKAQAMMRLRDWVTSSELVIHGDCPDSPDMWAIDIAKEFGVLIKAYPANWAEYAYAAGPMRNEKMVKECTMALIFWDGKSKGAKNVIELCMKYHKEHLVVMPPKDDYWARAEKTAKRVESWPQWKKDVKLGSDTNKEKP